MQTDALTLKIYSKVCEFNIEQIKLNIDLVIDIKSERTLHKLPYAFHNEQKQINVDAFTCKFVDAFDIKTRYDKLVNPKERFYYFNQISPLKEIVEVIIPAPAKPKRIYRARIKPPILRLPNVSLLNQVLIYFKIK